MPMQGVQRAPRMHFAPRITSTILRQCQEHCRRAGLHAPLARSLPGALDALQQLRQRTVHDTDLVETRRRSSGKLPPASRRRRRRCRSPAALLLRSPSAAHVLPCIAAYSAAPSSRSSDSSSSGMSKAQLLEDIFEVLEKDPDGKKFDKGGLAAGALMDAVTCGHAAAAVSQLAGQAPPPPPLHGFVSHAWLPAHAPLPHPPVSRIKARSDLYEMDLTLDVNTDVYPGAGGRGCGALVGFSRRPPLQQARRPAAIGDVCLPRHHACKQQWAAAAAAGCPAA